MRFSLISIFYVFCLSFKLTFTIFEEFKNDFPNHFSRVPTMAASADMFFITIDYKNKTNMKVAATNENIKMHQLLSRQRILGVNVTIVEAKISRELTRTCFLNSVLIILVKITMNLTLIFINNSFFNYFVKMKNKKRTAQRFPVFYENENE